MPCPPDHGLSSLTPADAAALLARMRRELWAEMEVAADDAHRRRIRRRIARLDVLAQRLGLPESSGRGPIAWLM